MTKQVSDCHGAEVERRGRSGVSRDGITHIDTWCYVCSRCHKPCKSVAREEKEQPLMDKETAGDMKYHALKDEGEIK